MIGLINALIKILPRTPHRTPKHYPWKLKYETVVRANQGENLQDIAKELDIVSYPLINKWLRIWRVKGVRGLMIKKEQIEVGFYKSKAQLKQSLPDDLDELKDFTAKLLVHNAVLKKSLSFQKNLRASSRKNCQPSTRR